MNSVIKKAAGLSECWFWSELGIMKWTEWNYDSGLSLFSHHCFSMENGKEQVLFLLWRQSISFVVRFPNLAEEYTLFHSWTGLVVFTVRWLCCFNLETRFQMMRILLDKVYPCICNDPSVLFVHLYL